MKSTCIVAKINGINKDINKLILKRINEENLPILQNHIPLFSILSGDKEPLLFNELAGIWQISKSSLSDIVNKYETKGFVLKGCCHEDKRSIYIGLTDEGVKIKSKLEEITSEILDLLLKGFSEDQKCVFEECINKTRNNIKGF